MIDCTRRFSIEPRVCGVFPDSVLIGGVIRLTETGGCADEEEKEEQG